MCILNIASFVKPMQVYSILVHMSFSFLKINYDILIPTRKLQRYFDGRILN